MMFKCLFFSCFLLWLTTTAQAQPCTAQGHTPASATYICSGETFNINSPVFCGTTPVPAPFCADGFPYQNTNPDFFRFNCYNAGTLGFTIVPLEAAANFNWQLFDITNTNPFDIFTNPALYVACNWSSELGTTGASIDGSSQNVCSGPSQPLFSSMPGLLTGHTYLLMICNMSSSTSGYELTLTGGSAVITDAIEPHLEKADLNCDRTRIKLRLNKQLRCNTVAVDGSDFTVSGGVNVIGAVADDCSSPFGTITVTLTLNQPLGFGIHTLTMANGSDGNSLLDICSRSIPAGESVSFISAPVDPTPMDSLFNVVCGPSYIELVFKKPILCSSVAPDGSDFVITGPQPVTATPVLFQCLTGSSVTTIIRLDLSSAVTAGTYQVRLVTGTDGNTLLNECGIPTPAGETLSFNSVNAVSARFTRSNTLSCTERTITFYHNGNNNINSWNWNFGNGASSTVPNPTVIFGPGLYHVRLTVSNGVCTSTDSLAVRISDPYEALFEAPEFVCPEDTVRLVNKSKGNIDNWQWSFGNGMTSNLDNPSGFQYTANGRESLYTIRLIVSNTALGCRDTSTRVVKVFSNCRIAVPTAFTPNGDGLNDFLCPLNALKADDLEFRVYNRVGQLVFFTRDWTKKWDGRINGLLQDSGVYAWLLRYTNRDTGEKVFRKGTTVLLR
jgi:gliding motility-associated-like protein